MTDNDDDGDTLSDVYRDLKGYHKGKAKAAGKRRRKEAERFEENKRLALSHGYVLQWHSESHFQITRRDAWTLNLYPGNQRIYRGKERNAPYLELPSPWTIRDVIVAAAQKEKTDGRYVDGVRGVPEGAPGESPDDGANRLRGEVRSDC